VSVCIVIITDYGIPMIRHVFVCIVIITDYSIPVFRATCGCVYCDNNSLWYSCIQSICQFVLA